MNIKLNRFKNIPKETFEFLSVLSSKFNPEDEEHVEAAANVAFLYFAADELDDAKAVLQELVKINYDGNYNLWTWVEYAWALMGFLTGDTEEFQKLTQETLKAGTEDEVFAKSRVFKRFQEGQTLTEEEIEEAIKDDDIDDELTTRLELLMDAVKLHSLGGGTPGYEALEKIIEEQKQQIKIRCGLSQIAPLNISG